MIIDFRRLGFLATPIVALLVTLPQLACVSPGRDKEPLARQQSAQVTLTLGRATKVAGSFLHGCALMDGGRVTCWGLGASGQLGNGNVQDSSVPVAVTGLSDAVAVSVGGAHT